MDSNWFTGEGGWIILQSQLLAKKLIPAKNQVLDEDNDLQRSISKHLKQADKRKAEFAVSREYTVLDNAESTQASWIAPGVEGEIPPSWDSILSSKRIIVLDFWTFSCVNCMHVLQDMKQLRLDFSNEESSPILILGIHSPKFPHERDFASVTQAVSRYDINYPIIHDPSRELWKKLQIRSWPTVLVIGPQGNIIFFRPGEGHYNELRTFLKGAIRHYTHRNMLSTSLIVAPEEKRTEQSGVETLEEQPTTLEKRRNGPHHLLFPGKLEVAGELLFVSDSYHNRVVVVAIVGEDSEKVKGKVVEVIGSGKRGLKDGSFEEAEFAEPQGLCLCGLTELSEEGMVLREGSVIVADRSNHCLREIDFKTRTVKTLCGTGGKGVDVRGGRVGTQQPLCSPWDVCFLAGHSLGEGESITRKESGGGGVVFIAMAGLNQIWGYAMGSGIAKRLSGNGMEGHKDSELLKCASWAQPSGLTLSVSPDGQVTLFIADTEANCIRYLSFLHEGKGAIGTIVGADANPNNLFAFGDVDGEGMTVRLQHPVDICIIPQQQTALVLDTFNHKLKHLDLTSKTITTLCGGTTEANEDVDTREKEAEAKPQQRFNAPEGVACQVIYTRCDGDSCFELAEPITRVFVADTGNSVIKVVDTIRNEVSSVRPLELDWEC